MYRTFNDKPKQRLPYIPDRVYKTVTSTSAKRRKELVPSVGQQADVQTCRTHKVIVSTCPGTGKTATAEAIVAAYPNELNTILLYNKDVQIDTLEKYSNADSYTFHAMAGQLFGTVVPNDTVLRALREKGDTPVWTGKLYQRIILDELTMHIQHCAAWINAKAGMVGPRTHERQRPRRAAGTIFTDKLTYTHYQSPKRNNPNAQPPPTLGPCFKAHAAP
ncbi:hypothetical protein DM02DRAFT_732890 [Periconia macrospinosa]|uniref:Uncharacterized protein n=1 Tax=Periconia macrospinosa TaxID=97972 RepID=A0A2V1D6P9_9PLEO|nr:hypothetical protein DM02DRAFT_732890 [Periconia macrospinosa]